MLPPQYLNASGFKKQGSIQLGKAALLIAPLLMFEVIIFTFTSTTFITPFYPRFFDQVQYLRESYLAYEEMKKNGMWSAIYSSLSNQVAQGVWHDFFALLSMSIFGPNRLSALIVNFFWLILFQISLFLVTLRSFRNISIAWMAFLMPLSIKGIWLPNVGGALYDFRLDHLAMCMMGLSIIACIKTEKFTNRKWAILFGVMTSITITSRFLTAAYFCLIFIFLFSALLMMKDKKFCISNLIIAAFAASPISIIFFYMNWARIYDYYLVGHVVGIEKAVRASGLSILETFEYISINGLYQFQGIIFFAIYFLILISYLIVAKNYKGSFSSMKFFSSEFSWWKIIGFIFFISPMIILSFESEAQNAVLSIITPGLIIFSLGFIAPCYLNIQSIKPKFAKILMLLITVVCIINFTISNIKYSEFKAFEKNADKISGIADYIFQYSGSNNSTVKIATNRIVEFLDGNILKVFIYERHHQWLQIEGVLPGSHLEMINSQVYEKLKQSDLVFSIESPAIVRGFPSELQMQSLKVSLENIYNSEFKQIEIMNVFNQLIVIYERKK